MKNQGREYRRSGVERRLKNEKVSKGEWKMEAVRDSRMNRDDPQAYRHDTIHVRTGETMAFLMVPGGGFVARFSRKDRQ
jgi:hypothetical protein